MKRLIPKSFKRMGKTRRELEGPKRLKQDCQFYLAVLVVLSLPVAAFIIFPKITLVFVAMLVLCHMVDREIAKYRRSKLPPPVIPRAFHCPACESEELEILDSGFWSGYDDVRHCETGGGFAYAICKKCGGRCAEYVSGKSYIPTEVEWQNQIDLQNERDERHNERLKKRAKWPFVSDD